MNESRTLLAALLSAALCFSCGGGEAEDGAGEGDGEQANASVEVDTYGEPLALEEATAIPALLADPEAYAGRTLRVEGTVVNVCEKRGCWIDIGQEGEEMRFKVDDGVMIFPMSAAGSHVVAEGEWQKVVIPLERMREIRAEQAAAKGEEFDPESVTEPLIYWQLKGTGAEVSA